MAHSRTGEMLRLRVDHFSPQEGSATALGQRRLLQAEPVFLSPLIPWNFGFGNGETIEFDTESAFFNFNLQYVANLITVLGANINLFGDFPLLSLGIPQMDLFGGIGVDLLEGIVEPGPWLVAFTSFVQLNLLDFSANIPLVDINIFKNFGFDELGIPESVSNLFYPPYEFEGLIQMNVVEKPSFLKLVKIVGETLFNTAPRFYGIRFPGW
eukprot:CAMPEP_0198240124 /NCGR_PEP_ID=MMETSP1446-20131203/5330_1 /TAXON_ID=1461542 ORGANISM="Unidentified sp, Strain CCMP2111" /NCGR_SAMPLE_ID=MMETSP1446 /ASSEMBLY_ACC=CAM_ASM_001112 /LENGTH=210 /DNA_ID=CAMNT_0043922815 /DNA_START=385 /DNA_END=1017 /DNA_ORIENTATION=-